MGLRTMKRRRREGRTDYKLRVGLLKSGVPRIVIRRTNKYFIIQVVESVEAQDKVVMTISSKELLKFGWDAAGAKVTGDGQQMTGKTKRQRVGNLKSIPAGYLTGLLFAKKLSGSVARGIPSKKGNYKEVPSSSGKKYIVDLGMARTKSGCRMFAVVKGLVDGGLNIVADKKVFPSEERLMGEHIGLKDMVNKCKDALGETGNGRQATEKVTTNITKKTDGMLK